MNETFIPINNFNKKKWYLIDCKKKKLGRLSAIVVLILSGKLKPYYHPSLDLGDYVILINAKDLLINPAMTKFHVFKPGRPGHSLTKLKDLHNSRILELAIAKMMPNCLAKSHLSKRLKIYQKTDHPHKAQNPEQFLNFTHF